MRLGLASGVAGFFAGIVIAAFAAGVVLLRPAYADIESSMQLGIDIPGGDYYNFGLALPDPGICRQACEQDNRCRGWTFVKPGVQVANAVCWLKDRIGPRVQNVNAISATRPSSAGGPAPGGTRVTADMMLGINLPGGDIASFALQNDDPFLCLQACQGRADCRGWTFVRPGAQATRAMCWLKGAVPTGRPFDATTISGLNGPAGTTGGAPTQWGVWASAAGGRWDDPCAIHYNAAQIPNNRYDGNPGYRRVRTRATQREADLDIDHFGRFHRDQPDNVVKMRSCHPSRNPNGGTTGATTGGAPAGTTGGAPTDWGVWASAAGGRWNDPCAIHYNAAQLLNNRYDGNPGYRRVRTRATQREADLDIDHFGRFHRNRPDGVVKMVPCGSDAGDGAGSAAGAAGAGQYGPWMTGTFSSTFGTIEFTPAGGRLDRLDGRFEVTSIEGPRMRGIWRLSTGNRRCGDGGDWGRFDITFTERGFSGGFGGCDGDPVAAWNGVRR